METVKLLKDWKGYRKGETVRTYPGVANLLTSKLRIAIPVKEVKRADKHRNPRNK
tara:strand:- start:247 stop:411 length:165 start_codon:yes stop_codon:yes gene_type:complete